jgi:hypothetical protein
LSLEKSTLYVVLSETYVGNGLDISDSTAVPSFFDASLTETSWTLPITVDNLEMTLSIKASVSGQIFGDFAVSFANTYVLPYTTICDTCASFGPSTYLDVTGYDVSSTTVLGPNGPFDGYSFDAAGIAAPICLKSSGDTPIWCSPANVDVEAVT